MSTRLALNQASSVMSYILCSHLAGPLNTKYKLSVTTEELMGLIGGSESFVSNVPTNLLGQVSNLAGRAAAAKKTTASKPVIQSYDGGCMYVYVRGELIKGTFCTGKVLHSGDGEPSLCNKHKDKTANPIYEIGDTPIAPAPTGKAAKRAPAAGGASRIQPKDIDYKVDRLNSVKIDGYAALLIEGTSMVVTLDNNTKPPTMVIRGYIDDNRVMPLVGPYLEEANSMTAGSVGRPGSAFSINSISKAINMGTETYKPAAPVTPAPRSRVNEISKNGDHKIMPRPRIMPANAAMVTSPIKPATAKVAIAPNFDDIVDDEEEANYDEEATNYDEEEPNYDEEEADDDESEYQL